MALTQVSSEGIKDAQVKTADILDANITTAKVADDAITNAKIANNSINGNKLQDDCVATSEIQDNAVTGAKVADNLDIPDNNKIRFGTGNDLQIFHDGTDSYLNSRTGNLYLAPTTSTENGITVVPNGEVRLYYDNSKKFETQSWGIDVTGTVQCDQLTLLDNEGVKLGTGNDFQIFHDGSHTYLDNYVGNVIFRKDNNEIFLKMVEDGTVELFHNGTKKFETTSVGVTVSGNAFFNDNYGCQFGNAAGSADLVIYHDGTNSLIKNGTGILSLQGDDIRLLNNAASEAYLKASNNGAVQLFYDSSLKFETTSSGGEFSGTDLILDAGTGSSSEFFIKKKGSYAENCGIGFYQGSTTYGNNRINFRSQDSSGNIINDISITSGARQSLKFVDNAKATFGTGDDLQLYHDGSHSFIDNNTGNLYIDVAAGNDIRLRANDENIIWGHGDGEVILYHNNAKKIETTSTGVLIDSTNNGYGGLKLEEFSSGSYGCNYILGRDDGAAAHVFKRGGRTQNQSPWADATGNEIARISRGGIAFNGDTAEANTLHDYEEGDLSWQLRKSDNTSGGTNNGSVVKYTKVGRMVNVSGKIRTDSTSSSGSYVFHLDGTLPFSPSASGTAVIGHLRSQDDESGQLTASVAWMAGSSTVYIYTLDSQSNLTANENNVGASTMTNLVMTFSLTYQAS